MLVIFADNPFCLWRLGFNVYGGWSFGMMYDFHLRPICACHFYGDWNSPFRCIGFVWVVSTFDEVSWSWRRFVDEDYLAEAEHPGNIDGTEIIIAILITIIEILLVS